MNNDPIIHNQDIMDADRPNVSPAVIKRLPRYFRYLRELLRQGKMRISSGMTMAGCVSLMWKATFSGSRSMFAP